MKVPKSKGGQGVKSSSKLPLRSALKSSGKGTPKTASASSAKLKPIRKPVYFANKGTLNAKISAQQSKGSKSHGVIKPRASHDRSNDSESEQEENNDVDEEEDEESASELWNEGRDDENENILRSLKKAVEKLKNNKSSVHNPISHNCAIN